jgi:hypothetical protein
MGTPRRFWLALSVAAIVAPFGALGAGDFETCHAYAMEIYEWALPWAGEQAALEMATNIFNYCMQEPE